MGRIKAMSLSIMGMLAVCSVLLVFSTYAVYHRSIQASLEELRMTVKDTNWIFANERLSAKYIRYRGHREEEPFQLPDVSLESRYVMYRYQEIQVLVLEPEHPSEDTVLFLHGGAYVNDLSASCLRFCDRLAQESGSTVVIPLYPLAPKHNYTETYDILLQLYQDMRAYVGEDITIMGDSAGGGLAAGFCEYLGVLQLAQPEHMVLISPWVDITMSNEEISTYARKDPMLAAPGLIRMGEAWAGFYGHTDGYRLSPVNGDVSGLRSVTLFVGTREIFYPDVVRFYEKLQDAGVESRLYIGRNLNHVYPMMQIPEADTAMQQICEAIHS